MLRPVTFVAALALCLTALLDNSAAGACRRRGGGPWCSPCPTWCAPQEYHPCCDTPCCSRTGLYELWYCIPGSSANGGWVAQGFPDSYDNLYNQGINAGRTYLPCPATCPGGYGAKYFTVCPYGQPPYPMGAGGCGRTGTSYVLWYCIPGSGVTGGWVAQGPPDPDYNKLYQQGINAGRKPLPCPSACPGGRDQYFTVCEYGISPYPMGHSSCGQ
jgi:hypothetical protein